MKKQFAKMMGISGVALLAVAPMVETGAATVGAVRTVNVVKADDTPAADDITKQDMILTIVKYQMPTDQANIDKMTDGDGSQRIDLQGNTPLQGVQFEVVKVKRAKADQKIDPNDETTYQTIGDVNTLTTDKEGKAEINFGNYSKGKGVYLVKELDSEGLTKIKNFLVQMPLNDQAHVYVYPKNKLSYKNPTITKDRAENLDYTNTQDANTAADNAAIIGTKVDYTLNAIFPDTTMSEAYILDPIYEGLTFDKVNAVLLDGTTKLVEGTDYTVGEVKNDNRDLFATQKINFTKDGMDKIKGHSVTVNLSAKVNEKAMQDIDGHDQVMPIQNTADVVAKTANGANITPGTSSATGMLPGDPKNDQPSVPANPLAADAKTSTKATNVQIKKIDSVDKSALSGAKFQLYDQNKNAIAGSEVTTNDQGEAIISGLEQGKIYFLKETEAPKDYVKDEDYIQVKTDKIFSPGNEQDPIENDKDVPLEDMGIPLTGGQLRIMLMVTGTILILGAGYILIKKRKEEENA